MLFLLSLLDFLLLIRLLLFSQSFLQVLKFIFQKSDIFLSCF